MTNETIAEIERQIRAYEATVHNLRLKNEALQEAIVAKDNLIGAQKDVVNELNLQLDAVGAGGVQALVTPNRGYKLQVIASQVLRDMKAEALAAPKLEAKESKQTPFANCRFQICDLPGQCKGEGMCHHPIAPQPAQSIGADGVAADPLQGAANWGTPQPVVREPLCDKELANLAKVGAIATDESGKVVMWPALYRNQMVCRFERGWREAEKYHGITQMDFLKSVVEGQHTACHAPRARLGEGGGV